MSTPAEVPVELPTGLTYSTPRTEWPQEFRAVVEHFEAARDWESFEYIDSYRHDDPHVLEETVRAPVKPDADKEYSWHVLYNPWPNTGMRTCWIMDGRRLRHDETVAGAENDDLIAKDRDLTEIGSGRVTVCAALTKVVGIHSRGINWLIRDEDVREQCCAVIDRLGTE
jgi:hypothetical protein